MAGCLPAFAEVRCDFDAEHRIWTLANSRLEAQLEVSPGGYFRFLSLRDPRGGGQWRPPAAGVTSPIRFVVDGERWDAYTPFLLLSHDWRVLNGAGRLTLVLANLRRTGEVTLEFDVYDDLPTLRYGIRYRNRQGRTTYVTEASPVAWEFGATSERYTALRVEQWLPVADPADFEVDLTVLPGDGTPLVVDSGSHHRYCTWLALAGDAAHGLAIGWEFDGRAHVSAALDTEAGRLTLDSHIPDLHHPVRGGDEFQAPRAFLTLFQGDWDEAGYQTQRFVERALAKAPPGDGSQFPHAGWDSWAYGVGIDEASLRRSADAAARLGIELFVVDLGWARSLGDWHEDPAKFPSGLRALSDYVHSLGMKFGLHFAFGEAGSASPIFQRRGLEWTSSVNYNYYGAHSLCLAHEPVRRWIAAEAVRIIDDYNVDWILQDGENMVRECRREDHTHHPGDSNYAGAVDGLGWILQEVQSRRPHVGWENCENGGNLMTFQMVQNYVTSIVNDASGALGARQSVYGATFPFPVRYATRYMPEQSTDDFTLRSYLFGGPWMFMNRIDEYSPQQFDEAARKIERFKRLRPLLRRAKVLHLTPPPAFGATDAMAAWDAAADSGVAVVTRHRAPGDSFQLRLGEAAAARSYRITFAGDPRTLTVTGAQLQTDGVEVRLPEEWYGEVALIEPLR